MLRVVFLAVLLASRTAAAQTVTVIADDYSFTGVPDTVRAGTAVFALKNVGSVRHEMSIILLTPNADVTHLMTEGLPVAGRNVAAKLIGLLVARPHEEAGGRLTFETHAGERYLVYCNLKDAATAPPHSRMGMYRIVIVGS